MESVCRITSIILVIVFIAALLIPITFAVDFENLFEPSAEEKLNELFSTWNVIESHEKSVEQNTKGDMKIVEAMYEYISSLDNVTEIIYENEYYFSFQLSTGLWSEYHRFGDISTNEYVFDSESFDFEPVKDIEVVGSKVIGVYSPYYGVDQSMTTNYYNAAQGMVSRLGPDWTVEAWYGNGSASFCTGAGNVESFKNFGKYSVVLVDSHGSSLSATGKSYIWVPIPGEYDLIDIAEGHLMYSGGEIGVSGTYIEKYCTLPNSFIYLGICEGMMQLGTAEALIRAGAGFVCGYNDSVSFTYDGQMMPTICQYISTVHKTDTTRTYSAAEACNEAKKKHGAVDPYAQPTYKAVLIWLGNEDLVLWHPIPVEGVEIIDKEIDLYISNTHKFTFETTPLDANGYNVRWESDAPEVASINERTGEIVALSEGVANITLTVSDTYGSGNTFSSEAVVNVLGVMHAEGISFESAAYDTCIGNSIAIPVVFTPANTSNKEVTWSIDNPAVAEIDENGVITPLSIGKSRVTATSVDGGFIATTTLRVLDLNGAINAERGKLNFTTSPQNYAWKPFIYNDKVVAISGNTGVASSSSILSLSINLNKGQKLTFDYLVSSEQNKDVFSFIVNGSEVFKQSGTTNTWKNYTYTCSTTRSYTFIWQYAKDYKNNSGFDGALIDNILISSGETEEQIPAGEIIFSEYFETNPFDSGWTVENLTDYDKTWEHDTESGNAYEGEGFMHSYSYIDGVGEVPHTNLLVSPAITIPKKMENMTLSFRAKASDYIWESEEFTVLVGISPDNLAEKQTFITTGDYQRYTIDLTDYADDTIYIAFRHNDKPAQSSLCLDNVELYATINPVYKLTYYLNGEFYAQFEHTAGEKIEPLEAPSQEGYAFSGWQGLPEAMPAHDVDVAGTLMKMTFTVTFWDSIANTEISNITVEYGDVVTEFPAPPEHEGYLFLGWDYDNLPVVADITIAANYLLLGDVNNDGVINTGDAVIVLKGTISNTLNEQQKLAADFNQDGKLNTGDAVAILKYIVSRRKELF
jgi:uncharacterized protein YjdB